MEVGFHFNFGLGWEGCGLVIFVISGVGLFFYNFLGGLGVGGGLLWKSYFKCFFTLFLNIFLTFFSFLFIIIILFCGGTVLIFVQYSLIQSHNFLCTVRKCKSWTVCFFVFGHRHSAY